MKALVLILNLTLSSVAVADILDFMQEDDGKNIWNTYDDYKLKEEQNFQAQLNLLRTQNIKNKRRAAARQKAAQEAHEKFLQDQAKGMESIRKNELALAAADAEREKLWVNYIREEEKLTKDREKYEIAKTEHGNPWLGTPEQTVQAKRAYEKSTELKEEAQRKYRKSRDRATIVSNQLKADKIGMKELVEGGFIDKSRIAIESDLTKAQKKYNDVLEKMRTDGIKADRLEGNVANERMKWGKAAAKEVFDRAGQNIIKADLILTDLKYLAIQEKLSEQALQDLQNETGRRLEQTMLGQFINEKIENMEAKVQTSLCEEAKACLKGKNVFGQRLLEFMKSEGSFQPTIDEMKKAQDPSKKTKTETKTKGQPKRPVNTSGSI